VQHAYTERHAMEDLIEVIIKECTPDFNAGQYRVVLVDRKTGRVLTIWVGQFEGGSITLGLEQTWTPRPLTHDLMAGIITQLNATVERITDLRDNTFFAIIYLALNGTTYEIDARPSDAMALAVRMKCPVFVNSAIADKMVDELDDMFDRMEPKATIH
jgi:bifunctional DNase/RNase